jgi:hypothetical protein
MKTSHRCVMVLAGALSASWLVEACSGSATESGRDSGVNAEDSGADVGSTEDAAGDSGSAEDSGGEGGGDDDGGSSAQACPGWIVNGDGTARDLASGFTWQVGHSSSLNTAKEAKAYCAGLSLAAKKWIVPSLSLPYMSNQEGELQTLLLPLGAAASVGECFIDVCVFGKSACTEQCWASSTVVHDGGAPLCLTFYGNWPGAGSPINPDNIEPESPGLVRCLEDPCPSGQALSNGTCCPTAKLGCGGSCVDYQTDSDNCGGCGNLCRITATNATSACIAGCCDSKVAGSACTVTVPGDVCNTSPGAEGTCPYPCGVPGAGCGVDSDCCSGSCAGGTSLCN